MSIKVFLVSESGGVGDGAVAGGLDAAALGVFDELDVGGGFGPLDGF